MTRLRFPIVFLLAAACTNGGSDDTDPAELIAWEPVVQSDARGAYLMVWGPDSSDEVWVVGGQPEVGVVLRGTRAGLQPVELPEGTPLLNWVHGTSSTDVWVGGLSGTILHWDGTGWIDASIDMEEAVWGVHAVSLGEVYAVGGSSAWGGEKGRIFRRTLDTWTELEVPEVLGEPGNLFKAFHDGTTLWACGLGGTVVRTTDGETLDAVGTGFGGDIVTVHGLPGADPIFVGGRGTGAVLEVSGDALAKSTSVRSGLSGVHVLPDGTAVVVGERGYAGIFDPATDLVTEAVLPTDDVLHGVYVDTGGTVWTAGGNLYTSEDTFEGSVWVGTLAEE